jgi:hypothetical protein
MNNGNKTNYCTGRTRSSDDNVCLAAKSTICCTTEADYTDSSKSYYYFYNENQSNDGDHTACGSYFNINAPGKPGGSWMSAAAPGGSLPATGVYED